jgi:hypothetical protein
VCPAACEALGKDFIYLIRSLLPFKPDKPEKKKIFHHENTKYENTKKTMKVFVFSDFVFS